MEGSCASGAHQIQCVAFDMSGTFNMLSDVETIQESTTALRAEKVNFLVCDDVMDE